MSAVMKIQKLLSDDAYARIDRELLKFPADQKQSAVMAALAIAQDEKGWVSPEVIEDVAAYLAMPPIAVHEVATFYNMYATEPVGKFKVSVCTCLPCALRDGNLRNQDGLAGYICGTMRNRVRNHFRSLHLDSVGAMKGEPVLDDPNPEEELESAERLALAQGAIAQLSAEDREILRLTLVEGLSPKEISQRLGVSGDVTRQRKSRAIHRAREILRSKLSQSE